MILYFLRHANAGEKKKDPKKDELRGLDGTGVGQCYQAARLFSRLEVVPDLIISSPLKRAMQTAALVANEIGYDDRLRVEKSLRPEAHWEDFLQRLKSYKADAVIVVGHSPNLSQFLGRMISKAGGRAAIDLKKGGIARAEYDGRSGELQWLLTPKFIREANAASHVEGIAPVSLPVSAFSFDQKTKKKEKPAKPKSGRGKRGSNSKQQVSKKK